MVASGEISSVITSETVSKDGRPQQPNVHTSQLNTDKKKLSTRMTPSLMEWVFRFLEKKKDNCF